MTCLLGASGAGKTTLIRLMLGAIKPDSGRVVIDGTVMPNLQILSRIGFMPQDDALYNNLTAMENLRFYAGLHHISKDLFQQRAKTLLEMVGLTSDANRMVGKFSGGMRKRLSLAVVALNDPQIMMLDEPTVGIDPVLRRSIWQQFRQWCDEGKTLIISTHVMDEVDRCDYAVLLQEGRIRAYDTVENLLAQTTNGKIEELFLRKEVTK
jgi:ABC-2 type transport system ATP-binding protein